MSTQDNKHLGFVGIGRMGAPMVERLLAAGYTLSVYDTNTAATDALAAKGVHVAASPKAVADRAETVLISLPMPAIVLKVGTGENGLSSGNAVRCVIDLSTTGPLVAGQLAQALADRNIDTIDCPVSGGVGGATRGTLALMAAGARSRFDAILPILNVLGKPFYVGERPGMAQTMKVLNNLISVTALSITSEAMVMGAKAGLDPDLMLEVINAGSGRTNASEDKIPKFVLSRQFNFGFAIGLSVKDVGLCIDESERLGVPMRVGKAAQSLVQAARDAFGDQADMTEIIRLVENETGVEVRGKSASR